MNLIPGNPDRENGNQPAREQQRCDLDLESLRPRNAGGQNAVVGESRKTLLVAVVSLVGGCLFLTQHWPLLACLSFALCGAACGASLGNVLGGQPRFVQIVLLAMAAGMSYVIYPLLTAPSALAVGFGLLLAYTAGQIVGMFCRTLIAAGRGSRC